MRKYITALLATAAIAAIAGPASAAVNVFTSSPGQPNLLQAGEVLVADFNTGGANSTDVLLSGFDLDLFGSTVDVNEGGSGYSGTLQGDPTHYLTIPGGASAVLTTIHALKTFSLYMGSPDTYNRIDFFGANGFHEVVQGVALAGNVNQDWGFGTRVNFDFGGFNVNRIVLSSGSNSFEVDNFAVTSTGVPEPAAWALMIMGFGAMGVALRRRRTSLSLA
jgi:hypothetical protein